MPEDASWSPAASEYEAKISHEATQLARRAEHAGPVPFRDTLSGIVFVAEKTVGVTSARMVDALRSSLVAVKLERAYVTWPHPDLLEEILSLEPGALVAIGLGAAHTIDSLGYPLAKASFSEAPEGSWFAWTKGTSGLRLPALTPALEDLDAKRRFWRAFLTLRALGLNGNPDPHL